MAEENNPNEFSEPDLSSDDMGAGPELPARLLVGEASSGEADSNGEAQPVGKRKGGKLRSPVWQHFTRGPVAPNDSYEAKCNYCGVKYLMGQQRSTGSLSHHYRRSCKKMPYAKRHKPDAMQKLLVVGSVPDQNLVGWEFNQVISRKGLCRMVIAHDYPFNIVNHHFFRAFLKGLQPSFKIPSRNTLRSDCLSIYAEEKKMLYDLLGNLDSRCSFTSDLWSNKGRDRGFLAITCHFIDSSWQLRKRVITFIPLPSPHTGRHIAEAINDQLVLWNLDKKMFSLVLDNCSANDAAIHAMLSCTKMCLKDHLLVKGGIFHQRCACHILNLIVQDGLSVLDDQIKSIRETMKYLRHSQSRMEKFSIAASQAQAPSKKPNWDVPTRWNSTYQMLVLAMELKPAIIRYASFDKNYLYCPSDIDWENVGALTECLRVFYEATMKLSGTKYPTLNLFFTEFCEVCLAIMKMEASPQPFIKEMGKGMYAKWEKYWCSGNTLLAIACVLDPRCKLEVVDYYFGLMYGDEKLRYTQTVKACLNELFVEYSEAQTKLAKQQAPIRQASIASTCVSDTRSGLKELLNGKKNSAPVKSEVDEYLSDGLDEASLDEHFDILAWWKLKSPKYPVLAKLTRDILAVPISTVASESTFSFSGRTLSPVRSCLNDESIEALICSQDWLRASVAEQGVDVGDPLWTTDGEVGEDVSEVVDGA